MKLETHTFHSKVHVSRKMRLKVWWMRRQMRRKFGQEFLDLMDECGREVERAFLLGQEYAE